MARLALALVQHPDRRRRTGFGQAEPGFQPVGHDASVHRQNPVTSPEPCKRGGRSRLHPVDDSALLGERAGGEPQSVFISPAVRPACSGRALPGGTFAKDDTGFKPRAAAPIRAWPRM